MNTRITVTIGILIVGIIALGTICLMKDEQIKAITAQARLETQRAATKEAEALSERMMLHQALVLALQGGGKIELWHNKQDVAVVPKKSSNPLISSGALIFTAEGRIFFQNTQTDDMR